MHRTHPTTNRLLCEHAIKSSRARVAVLKCDSQVLYLTTLQHCNRDSTRLEHLNARRLKQTYDNDMIVLCTTRPAFHYDTLMSFEKKRKKKSWAYGTNMPTGTNGGFGSALLASNAMQYSNARCFGDP
ncbi:hypothetical protein SeMB42_g02699 [Synchytrium endobioticum]|uniref:Uncharacterized protein n=1 Tax=Synchytrium endobioticum TaxID=286115 RepID=A0A507DE89_9FUNG|nr:hypothetical protein SeMB42_g02699 [Synchytrium endobioticum]